MKSVKLCFAIVAMVFSSLAVSASAIDPPKKNYRGIFIFAVATIAEAQALVQTDPAIKAGILIAEMAP